MESLDSTREGSFMVLELISVGMRHVIINQDINKNVHINKE